jgi:hypothetical protein
MTFPTIKRALHDQIEWEKENFFDYFNEDDIIAERRSRAVWAKALAKKLRNCSKDIILNSDSQVWTVIEELERVAGDDEK